MVCRLGKFELRKECQSSSQWAKIQGEARKELGSCHPPTALSVAAGEMWGLHPSGSIIIPTSIHSLNSDPSVYLIRLGTRLFLFLPERKEKVLADDLPGDRDTCQ